jgi:hypothetical protein
MLLLRTPFVLIEGNPLIKSHVHGTASDSPRCLAEIRNVSLPTLNLIVGFQQARMGADCQETDGLCIIDDRSTMISAA